MLNRVSRTEFDTSHLNFELNLNAQVLNLILFKSLIFELFSTLIFELSFEFELEAF